MLNIYYNNKEWKERILTYTDNEDSDIIWFDIVTIIEQGATDIRIN